MLCDFLGLFGPFEGSLGKIFTQRSTGSGAEIRIVGGSDLNSINGESEEANQH